MMELNSLKATTIQRAPPFFQATVTGHESLKSSRGKRYLIYSVVIQRTDVESPSITIARRYRDFCMLDMCLRWAWNHQLQYSLDSLPRVPPKRNKGAPSEQFDPSFIASRKEALDVYIKHLLRLPQIAENPDVLAFFNFVRRLDDVSFFEEKDVASSKESREDTNLSLNEFETVIMSGGNERLDQVANGPTRMTQDYATKLAVGDNKLEEMLKGVFKVDNVRPLLLAFERFRKSKTAVTEEDFQAYCELQVPSIFDILKARVKQIRGKMDPRRPFPPVLDKNSRIIDDASLKFLSGSFSECISCSNWNRLFASFEDGLSFQTLCTGLEGYEGPTLVVIEDTNGCRFGALASAKWREDNAFYSGSSGALFSLYPVFYVYRRKPTAATRNSSSRGPNKSENVQYMNARSKTLPLGIGFGGELHLKQARGDNVPHPRLWLDAEFDENFATLGTNDAVYEPGPLIGDDVSRETFQVAYVEAWGLGGSDAMRGRESWRAQKDRLIQRQRKVDKAQFANNSFDREYLLKGTFDGNKRETNDG